MLLNIELCSNWLIILDFRLMQFCIILVTQVFRYLSLFYYLSFLRLTCYFGFVFITRIFHSPSVLNVVNKFYIEMFLTSLFHYAEWLNHPSLCIRAYKESDANQLRYYKICPHLVFYGMVEIPQSFAVDFVLARVVSGEALLVKSISAA